MNDSKLVDELLTMVTHRLHPHVRTPRSSSYNSLQKERCGSHVTPIRPCVFCHVFRSRLMNRQWPTLSVVVGLDSGVFMRAGVYSTPSSTISPRGGWAYQLVRSGGTHAKLTDCPLGHTCHTFSGTCLSFHVSVTAPTVEIKYQQLYQHSLPVILVAMKKQ